MNSKELQTHLMVEIEKLAASIPETAYTFATVIAGEIISVFKNLDLENTQDLELEYQLESIALRELPDTLISYLTLSRHKNQAEATDILYTRLKALLDKVQKIDEAQNERLMQTARSHREYVEKNLGARNRTIDFHTYKRTPSTAKEIAEAIIITKPTKKKKPGKS